MRNTTYTWQKHDRGGVSLLRTPLIFPVSGMVMRNIVAAILVVLRSSLHRPKLVRVGELACHRATPAVPRRRPLLSTSRGLWSDGVNRRHELYKILEQPRAHVCTIELDKVSAEAWTVEGGFRNIGHALT